MKKTTLSFFFFFFSLEKSLKKKVSGANAFS